MRPIPQSLKRETVGRLMTQVPERAFELKVPLMVDIGWGGDWDSTKGGE